MKPVTFNTPLKGHGVSCPEQLFKSIDDKVSESAVIIAARDSLRNAIGLSGLLLCAEDDNGKGFMPAHEYMTGGIEALHNQLRQLEAVLNHPTN